MDAIENYERNEEENRSYSRINGFSGV